MMNMLLYTVIYCSTCLLSAEFWMLLQCKASGTKAPTIFSAHLHYQDEPGITRNISNISVFMRDCHHGTPRCSSSEVSSEVPTQTMQMNVYPINMTLESLSTSILGTWNGRWSHLFKFEISSGIYYPEVTIVQWLPTSAYMIGWHLDSAQAETQRDTISTQRFRSVFPPPRRVCSWLLPWRPRRCQRERLWMTLNNFDVKCDSLDSLDHVDMCTGHAWGMREHKGGS